MLGVVLFQRAFLPSTFVIALVAVVLVGLLAVVVSLRIARRLRAIGDQGATPDETEDAPTP